MLDDEPEPTASEFVDFTYYGEVIPAGLERPPRDVEDPRLWILTDDSARTLSDKKTHATYDESTSTSTSVAMPSSTAPPARQLARAWTRCRMAHLYRHSKQRPLPLSERVIAPTQRRRRPPVFDWASSASPRADERARIRSASSPNWPTSAYVAHGPRSPANWTRCAKLSSTAPLKSAYTPPTRRLLA
jgi:hypothetical protein